MKYMLPELLEPEFPDSFCSPFDRGKVNTLDRQVIGVLFAVAIVGLVFPGATACDTRGSSVASPEPPGQGAEPVESPKVASVVSSPDMAALDASALAKAQRDDDLVDVLAIVPDLQLDMRYASTNNFVAKVIYPEARCRLRRRVALAFKKVQSILDKDELRILIWDCYRPFSVQEKFWKLVPDSRYVAKPIRSGSRLVSGSKHNCGAAVDLTLANRAGQPVAMPTDFDDFSARAHVHAKGVAREPREPRDNAERLRHAMESAGFVGIATEWWHFDHKSWREFSLSDEPL